MSDLAIKVRGLGKCYKLGTMRSIDRHLREVIGDSVGRVFRRLRGDTNPGEVEPLNDDFWALRNVDFDLPHGEMLGIVGRNGAGKSTLLKILSRITDPTEGEATIRGRVGSLLEVGTGFHPELTGRENIYLNGTIIGMSRGEIKQKFDEIVEFSGVSKFLDTPVKRYSSGMTVRLAFSVAAHLDPEILIVDEVLAVGDAAFQKKCLGKLKDFAGQGRTVLFVSHNMGSVSSLCDRAIVLNNGSVCYNGPVQEALDKYTALIGSEGSSSPIGASESRQGGDVFRFMDMSIYRAQGGSRQLVKAIRSGDDVELHIVYRCAGDSVLKNVTLSVGLSSAEGTLMFACPSEAKGELFSIEPGEGEIVCRIPRWPLTEGVYRYTLLARQGSLVLDWLRDSGTISVQAGDFYGTGRLPQHGKQAALIEFDWEFVRKSLGNCGKSYA